MYRSSPAPPRIRAPSRNVGYITRAGTLHGQSLLGHSVSPLPRGEIPIGLSSIAFLSYSENLIQKRQYQPRFQPASFIAVRIIHIPGISIHMPGILIHILPESLFTSPRNRYSHAPEYATHMHSE